jgi:hypothetical protein
MALQWADDDETVDEYLGCVLALPGPADNLGRTRLRSRCGTSTASRPPALRLASAASPN